MTFGFDKDGTMIFLDIHSIDEWRTKASNHSMELTTSRRTNLLSLNI